ncbi:hypothetical protein ACVW00_003883 [Marmoricola sp. URHA0025 HA25]
MTLLRIGTSHFGHWGVDHSTKELDMIALGLILLIIGLVAGIPVLTTIGVILLVVGLILNLVPIGGSTRRGSGSHARRARAPLLTEERGPSAC